MIKIAVCEDDKYYRESTLGLISSYAKERDIEVSMHYFASAEELLFKIEEVSFDIILFDIYLGGMTGIECAKRLQDASKSYELIFISTSKEHIFEAFNLKATQYLIKPLNVSEFYLALDTAVNNINNKTNKCLVIKTDSGFETINTDSIIYCEKNLHHLYISTASLGTIKTRITLTEFWQNIEQYDEFTRVGVSFVVNLKYIKTLTNKLITLKDDTKISIPRGRFQEIKKSYLDFYWR